MRFNLNPLIVSWESKDPHGALLRFCKHRLGTGCNGEAVHAKPPKDKIWEAKGSLEVERGWGKSGPRISENIEKEKSGHHTKEKKYIYRNPDKSQIGLKE